MTGIQDIEAYSSFPTGSSTSFFALPAPAAFFFFDPETMSSIRKSRHAVYKGQESLRYTKHGGYLTQPKLLLKLKNSYYKYKMSDIFNFKYLTRLLDLLQLQSCMPEPWQNMAPKYQAPSYQQYSQCPHQLPRWCCHLLHALPTQQNKLLWTYKQKEIQTQICYLQLFKTSLK